MRALLQALRLRFRRRRKDAIVQLRYAGGGGTTLGPMDRYAAEVLVVNVLNPNPHWNGRRVTSSRVVVL